MSNIQPKFGSNNQSITVTLASLANGSARASTAIDNSSNLYFDILVQLKVKSGASAVSSTGTVNVYAVGSADGGTTYAEAATGTDAGITLTSPPNARLIGVINVVANATTYIGPLMSVAEAFGGSIPDHVVIIVENKSGAALDSTEGNHAKFYQGEYAQVV
jgi:hypothetical protein